MMIHVLGDYNPAEQPFNLSAVYNCPQPGLQSQLWQLLKDIHDNISGHWLITGDFNAILYPNEKIGEKYFRPSQAKNFNDCMEY